MPCSLTALSTNSRLHWALLSRGEVLEAWDSSHLGTATGGEEDGSAGESDHVGHGIPTSFISPSALETLRRHGSTLLSVRPGLQHCGHHPTVLVPRLEGGPWALAFLSVHGIA